MSDDFGTSGIKVEPLGENAFHLIYGFGEDSLKEEFINLMKTNSHSDSPNYKVKKDQSIVDSEFKKESL